jgi:uncharacterized protein YcfJ
MSISSKKKLVVVLVAAALTGASAGAFAQGPYDQRPYDRPSYDQGAYEHDRGDPRDYDDGDAAYDYARVIDVQPLTTRVRVTTPQRACWDETRVDERGYGASPLPRSVAGGAVLGGIVGAVIGHQIGHGQGRDAATAAGAVIGAAVGGKQAQRRAGYASAPPHEYTVQRCETRYQESWEERTDGYRVTYVYNGRRQVTEMPNRPGERIRVRVDVSPAE